MLCRGPGECEGEGTIGEGASDEAQR
jgi:hypothetical protein